MIRVGLVIVFKTNDTGDSTIDRTSTGGSNHPSKLKKTLSFGELEVVPDNKEQIPKKSALTAQIQKKRGGADADISANAGSQQFKDKDGNLVIQQLPFNQKKMVLNSIFFYCFRFVCFCLDL